MNLRRAASGALALAALLACERAVLLPPPAEPAHRAPPAARAPQPARHAASRERVFYPRGDCSTGWIQVQRYEAGRGWIAHPEHPRLAADTSHEEEPASLLDLRVRCFDPAGRLQPSTWVRGVSLPGAEASRSGAP